MNSRVFDLIEKAVRSTVEVYREAWHLNTEEIDVNQASSELYDILWSTMEVKPWGEVANPTPAKKVGEVEVTWKKRESQMTRLTDLARSIITSAFPSVMD